MRKSSENALVLKLFSCLEISKAKPHVLVAPVVIYTTRRGAAQVAPRNTRPAAGEAPARTWAGVAGASGRTLDL